MKQKFTRLLTLLAAAGTALGAYCGPALTITDAQMTKTVTTSKLYADSDNIIRGVKFNVTLENTGDAEVVAGKTLTIITRSDEFDLQTWPIPEAIAPGESKSFEFAGELDLSTLISFKGMKSSYWEAICMQEDVTFTTFNNKTSLGGSWYDLCPYVVDFSLTPQNSGVEVSDAIAFGFVTEPTTVNYRLRCLGSADVVITDIELPEGFSTDAQLPLTLVGRGNPAASNDNEYQNIAITLSPVVAGVNTGKIRFIAEGTTKEYDVTGSCVMPGVFYEGFDTAEEDAYVPAGWVLGNGWGVMYVSNSDTDKYSLAHKTATSGTNSFAITPLLHFGAGDAMSVSVGRRSYDSRLEIYYSPDRSNWTLLKTFTGRYEAGAEQLPSSGDFVEAILSEIPEGDFYIGFNGLYIFINDVFGGSPVAVDHDLMVTATEGSTVASVNHPYSYKVTARNLSDKTEAAGSYTVQLFVDGEAAGEAEAGEWAAGEEQSFEFGHVFHSAGEHSVVVVITAGNVEARSIETTVSVAAETSDVDMTVGAIEGNGEEGAPFKTWDKNSEAQVIYTEAFLAKHGIVPGTKINYVAFDARTADDKTVTATYKLWLKKVDEESLDAYAPYDISDEAPLYEQTLDVQYVKSDDFHEYVRMTIEGGYVYEGGNLLMVTRHQDANTYARVYFHHDSELTANAILKSTDSASSFLTMSYSASLATNGVPVARFGVYAEPATVGGTVTGMDGELLAGQAVELRSGDVLYSAVTDEEGKFSIEVFQSDLTYTLSAAKAGHVTATAEVSFAESKNVVADLAFAEFSDERAFTLTVKVDAPESVNLEGVGFTLTHTASLESYPAEDCVLAADGSASVAVRGGQHSLTLDALGAKPHSSTVDVKGDTEHAIALEAFATGLGLNELGAIAIFPNPVVDVMNIAGVESADVTVFNAAGAEVAAAQAVKSLNVGSLAPGSYVVVVRAADGLSVSLRMIKR